VNSNSFTVEINNNIVYNTSNYLLLGIKVTDFDRIAQANYARLFAGYSNMNSNGIIVSAISSSNTNFLVSEIDDTFNAPLYRMLYPDSRSLNDTQTYLDWVSKRKNEVYRIQNVIDIAYGNGNTYTNINYLNISSNMTFTGTFINGITEYLNPNTYNVPGDSNKLITENAIKHYADIRMANLQNQGSFTNIVINDSIVVKTNGTFCNMLTSFGSLYVGSNSTFSNDVTIVGNNNILSNLDVHGATTLRNSMMLTGGNATFSNNVMVNGSISVTGNIYNARIGLGYVGNYLASNNGFNIMHAQNYNDNSDARIKNNVVSIEPSVCLDTINKLDVVEFQYMYGKKDIDTLRVVGFIAQDVESNIGKYVYHTSEYIPNIMVHATLDMNRLVVDNNYDDNIIIGDVKLILDNEIDVMITVMRKLESRVYETTPHSYGTIPQKCLVYGSRIDDFKNIDYKQLFVLAVGGMKALQQQIDELKTSIHP
jgi:hypothetical protein